jgi:hypothetical protein
VATSLSPSSSIVGVDGEMLLQSQKIIYMFIIVLDPTYYAGSVPFHRDPLAGGLPLSPASFKGLWSSHYDT